MSLPFEQDVEIEKFIRKFKSKHRVRGTITVTITDSGFIVETDKNNLLEEETTQYEKGHKNGYEEAREEIQLYGGIELYHLFDGDIDTIEELIEYYDSRK